MRKIILLVFILLITNIVKADNETINITNNATEDIGFHDFKLNTNIDDKINIETEYDKFFKITYLNHTRGEKEQLPVFVYYNLTENNTLLKEGVFNVTVNSYTSSKTGEYYFDKEGDFKLCGEIISSGINESNFENNKACKNFTVISTFNISCNVSLSIETDKLIYDSGEKVSFKNILSNDEFKYKIEYWVEDLFGNIFKKSYETENQNKKSYTPKIKNKVEVLKIKARISYLACNDTNKSDNNYEKLFIVKGEDKKEEELKYEVCECEEEITKKSRKTELEFIELPKTIVVGKEFELKFLIINNDDKRHEYDVYSYIYRGSKCYSESREHNKKEIKVKAENSEIIKLKDKIEKAEDGEYKIKVKVKQDNLKGEKELRGDTTLINIKKVEINDGTEKECIQVLETIESENNINTPEIQEDIKEKDEFKELENIDFDYDSSSEKSKKLINYFILTTFALIVIIVVLKNG